jgi:hypothetical protein
MRSFLTSLKLAPWLFVFSACTVSDVDEEDRDVVLTIERFQEYGLSLPPDYKSYESFKRVQWLLGPVSIEYEFVAPEALGLPYLSSLAERHTSSTEACDSYSLGITGIGLSGTELSVRNELFQFGDKSTFGLLIDDGGPYGNYFGMCRGRYAFDAILNGVYFDDGEMWGELLDPSLRALDSMKSGSNDVIGSLILAVFLLVFVYLMNKYVSWFRQRAKSYESRYVKKHIKYVGWIRENIESAKGLSDDELRTVIQMAVTIRIRVQTTLVVLLIASLGTAYPIYAGLILGPSPPYWQEMMLGVAGGLTFVVFMRICGLVALRIRIRQLVGEDRYVLSQKVQDYADNTSQNEHRMPITEGRRTGVTDQIAERIVRKPDRKVRDVVEHAEQVHPHDSLMRKYDITAVDGKYEYLGMLYSTFDYALAAAKKDRSDS